MMSLGEYVYWITDPAKQQLAHYLYNALKYLSSLPSMVQFIRSIKLLLRIIIYNYA